ARDPRSADVRSDIYSLGCTLYFILTGRPPFPEGTVLQKLLQHQGDEPADPRTFRPELPEDLLQIMQRMLAKSPGKRYQSPAELVAELAAFAQRHGLPVTPTTSVVWVPPEQTPLNFWERHLPWMAPVALLVILVGVLNLFWPHDSGHAAPPPLHMPATEVEQSTGPATIAPDKAQMNDGEKQPAKELENTAMPAAPATPMPATGAPAPESSQSAPAASSTGPAGTPPTINNPPSESTEKKAPVEESKERKASDSESTPAKSAGSQGTVSPSP
ncbi:MAG TPA: serine/threonine-protein kinase, partial [Pirellulales bacterium]